MRRLICARYYAFGKTTVKDISCGLRLYGYGGLRNPLESIFEVRRADSMKGMQQAKRSA
jgi:hypothetical protein